MSMTESLERLSVEDIVELKRSLESDHADAHDAFDRDERYYDLDFKNDLRLPDRLLSHAAIVPTARDMVDTAADHIASAEVRILVPSLGDSEAARDQAKMLQNGYYGFLHRLRTESHSDPILDAAIHLFLHGLSGLKVAYDHQRWVAQPLREAFATEGDYRGAMELWRHESKYAFPIPWTPVHPKALLFDPTFGTNFVIEIQRRSVFDLKRRYPSWNGGGRRITEVVEAWEFWSRTHRACFIENEPVVGLQRHEYGRPPYIIEFGGFGHMDSEYRLDRRAVGILRYVFDLIVAESRAFTIADFATKYSAMPTYVGFYKQGRPKPNFLMEMGVINWMEVGENPPQQLRLFEDSQLMMHHMANINVMLLNSRAPRSVQGLREPGIGSGYQQSLLSGKAALRYEKTKDALARMISVANSRTMQIVEKILPGDITVWGDTKNGPAETVIDRHAVKGHYVNQVNIEPVSPEENARNVRTMIELVQTGILAPDTAGRRYLSNVDWEEEEVKRAALEMQRSPEFRRVVNAKAAEMLAQRLGVSPLPKPGGAPVMPLGKSGRPSPQGGVPSLAGIVPQPGHAPKMAEAGADSEEPSPGMATLDLGPLPGTSETALRPNSPEEIERMLSASGMRIAKRGGRRR